LKEHLDTEAYRRWTSFKGSQEAATLPSTTHAERAAAPLVLRIHADEIFSHPSVRDKPISK
jgi:hypothetical protein